MDAGKLPSDLLASLLQRVPGRDPRVVVGPGIGRDAAVIDTGGPNLLVATTDPVTFTGDMIGWYAVNVNANDVACTGATPAWFLATVLLPERTLAIAAEAIFDQLLSACAKLEIELVGGHTEITQGLDRPVVVGAMLGEVERDRLVRPDGARPGDALLLTKGIAIEGTALLAREEPDRLRGLGVTGSCIELARGYLSDPGISVVLDARVACDTGHVHAMHDPTEGGLATALHEMAEASNVGMIINLDQVRVLSATAEICKAASLDSLGVLASGALLIAVAEAACPAVLSVLAEAGITALRIGSLVSPASGVIMNDKRGRSKTVVPAGSDRKVQRFNRDEVARFLTEPVITKEHRGRAEAPHD